jgi:hypothetical protein
MGLKKTDDLTAYSFSLRVVYVQKTHKITEYVDLL